MNYLVYLLLTIVASCVAAAACLGGLWLLAPALSARVSRAPAGEDKPAPEGVPAAVPAPAPGQEQTHITFTLRREQLPMLAGMLRKETADNIAIVLSRMPRDLRPGLLALLDKEAAQQALVSLAGVRFVDKEMLRVLKEEIEKRIDGVIGGLEEAVALIGPRPYSERKEIIRRLELSDPHLAFEARAFFVLDDDFLSLSEKDLAALAAALPPDQLAGVFHSLPDKLKSKLRDQLDAKTLALVEQAAPAHAQTRKKKDEDLDKFMAAALALISSGRIAKPAVHMKPPPAVKPRSTESDW